MKSIFILLMAAAVCMTACTKKSSSIATPVTNTPIPANDVLDSTNAVLRFEGSFKSGPWGTVTGIARVYESNGKWQLRLTNFSTSSGPDLKVYLSKERQPLNFIKLGNLKSFSGSQSYSIATVPDFTQYRYALIHCEQFNHLFGSAELMMP